MAARKATGSDFQVHTDELIGQVRALVDISETTSALVSSARQLAERDPLLGTAPIAMHLAQRLREAAGPAGLTGEVSAADTELTSYHQALRDAVNQYQDRDAEVTRRLTDTQADT